MVVLSFTVFLSIFFILVNFVYVFDDHKFIGFAFILSYVMFRVYYEIAHYSYWWIKKNSILMVII